MFTSVNGKVGHDTAPFNSLLAHDAAYDSSQDQSQANLQPPKQISRSIKDNKRTHRRARLIDEDAIANLNGSNKRTVLSPVCDFHIVNSEPYTSRDPIQPTRNHDSQTVYFTKRSPRAIAADNQPPPSNQEVASFVQSQQHNDNSFVPDDCLIVTDDEMLNAELRATPYASVSEWPSRAHEFSINSTVPTLPLTPRNAVPFFEEFDENNCHDLSHRSGLKHDPDPWDEDDFDENSLMSFMTTAPTARPCTRQECLMQNRQDEIVAEDWEISDSEDDAIFFDLMHRLEDAIPSPNPSLGRQNDRTTSVEELCHDTSSPRDGIGTASEQYNIQDFEPPAAVRDRSYIVGMSSETLLRVCFQINDALQYGCDAARRGTATVIELYARVRRSVRHGEVQSFILGDIDHDEAPFLEATYSGWKGIELYDSDSSIFLDADGDGMLCRCLGRIVRRGNSWVLSLFSIWQVICEDIEHVRGIVQMQRMCNDD